MGELSESQLLKAMKMADMHALVYSYMDYLWKTNNFDEEAEFNELILRSEDTESFFLKESKKQALMEYLNEISRYRKFDFQSLIGFLISPYFISHSQSFNTDMTTPSEQISSSDEEEEAQLHTRSWSSGSESESEEEKTQISEPKEKGKAKSTFSESEEEEEEEESSLFNLLNKSSFGTSSSSSTPSFSFTLFNPSTQPQPIIPSSSMPNLNASKPKTQQQSEPLNQFVASNQNGFYRFLDSIDYSQAF